MFFFFCGTRFVKCIPLEGDGSNIGDSEACPCIHCHRRVLHVVSRVGLGLGWGEGRGGMKGGDRVEIEVGGLEVGGLEVGRLEVWRLKVGG